jgi:hypothetical protein
MDLSNQNNLNEAATESLGNIISAFANELSKASLAADLMRAKMKNVYEKNVILNQFEPSKIRLVTAKVILPVAFQEHKTATPIDPGLSKDQVNSLIGDEIPLRLRNKIASTIMSEIKSKSNKFSNSKLLYDMKKIVSKISYQGFDSNRHFNFARINEFKDEWKTNLVNENEAKFIYKAEDLAKLNPDNIVKFDITLDIS